MPQCAIPLEPAYSRLWSQPPGRWLSFDMGGDLAVHGTLVEVCMPQNAALDVLGHQDKTHLQIGGYALAAAWFHGRAYIRLTLARRWNRLPRTFQPQNSLRMRTLMTAPFPWLPGQLEPHRQKENDAEEDEVAFIDLKDNLVARSRTFISDEDEEKEEKMLEDAEEGEVGDRGEAAEKSEEDKGADKLADLMGKVT